MSPTSPYGCSKVFGFNIVQHYRYAYDLFAVNGILFNHESPRRGSNFVTNKVVKAAVRIKKDCKKTCTWESRCIQRLGAFKRLCSSNAYDN